MANIITPLVDQPFFELCNQLPVATSTLSSMVTTEDGSGRFLYYIVAAAFYRYDTWTDTWMQLPNLPVTPVGVVSMSYTNRRGSHGRVISATSSTVSIGISNCIITKLASSITLRYFST
jgi:hypothetical protein